MATVWAFREGVFQQNNKTAWSHTIDIREGELSESVRNISTLEQWGAVDRGTKLLIEKLEEQKLRGQVDRIAIVAHGKPGAVHMSGLGRPPATVTNLRDLGTYLKKGGMLSFVSCNAGQGPLGSQFLMALSRALPQRVIVGLSIFGFFEEFTNDPGNVQESPVGNRPTPGTPRVTPWGAYAKWAFEGKIVRLPMDEPMNAKRNTCCNPKCPGHLKSNDRCPYEKWGRDPVVLSYHP